MKQSKKKELWFMKNMCINLFVTILFLSSCSMIDEVTKYEIINAFSNFNNNENVALLKDNYIFLHNKELKIDKVNDKKIYLVGCDKNGLYAYKNENKKLDIILIDYEGKYTFLVDDYDVDSKVSNVHFYDNKLYFCYDYNFQSYFLIFDVNTLNFTKLSTDISLLDYFDTIYVYNDNKSKDKIIVTRKSDNICRIINNDLLNTIDEGKYILSLPKKCINNLNYTIIQKDEKNILIYRNKYFIINY